MLHAMATKSRMARPLCKLGYMPIANIGDVGFDISERIDVSLRTLAPAETKE